MENHCENPNDELRRMRALRDLSDQFAERAKNIGKKIIEELYLPPSEKTILPVTGYVGGIAGGEKYIEDGIFFKFALDNKGIYGGDEYAIKSGGHEFLGFLELINCRVQGLHFPFIVIIDYRGFRLIALSVLPIGSNTLVYGSSNGGNTIHNSDKEFKLRMKKVSKILNLTGHYVWDNSGSKRVKMYSAIDCEGHKGLDDRLYVVDPARLFPPSYHPGNEKKGSKLYRLMRPELVKMSPVPLCSDSFTSFKVENKEEHEKNIMKMQEYLCNTIIPEFAKELMREYSTRAIDLRSTKDIINISNRAHLKGINIRYLGYVYRLISEEYAQLRKLICTIIVGRTIKNLIRNHMRSLKSNGERPHKVLIVGYLNLTFGDGVKSNEFWNIHILSHLKKSFMGFIEDGDPPQSLKECIHPILLYFFILDKLGIEARNSLINFNEDGTLKNKFIERYIVSIYPKIKYTNRLSFEEGTAMSRMAILNRGDKSEKYFQLAEIKYKAALDVKPNDIRTLHNWGLSLMCHAESKSGEDADMLYLLAESKWKLSIQLNPNDHIAYVLWGNMLLKRYHRCKDNSKKTEYLHEAISKYKEGYNIKPDYTVAKKLATALLVFGSLPSTPSSVLKEAADLFKVAIKLKSNSFKLHHNLAVTYGKLARRIFEDNPKEIELSFSIFKKAYKVFDECLKMRADHSEVNFNYGNTLFRHAKILEAIDKEKCFKYCVMSAEKYVHTLNTNLSFIDAMYNWSNVIYLQLKLNMNRNETMFSLNYFLEVYKLVALKYGSMVSLNSLINMLSCNDEETQKHTFYTLVYIGNNAEDESLKSRAIKEINSYINLPFYFDLLSKDPSTMKYHFSEDISAIIHSIGTVGKIQDDNLNFDNFKIFETFEEDNGHHKIHTGTHKITKKHVTILEMEKDNIIAHLKNDGSIQNFVLSYRDLVESMKAERPFIATLLNAFQTERDTFCFVYSFEFTFNNIWDVVTNKNISEQKRYELLNTCVGEIILALKYLHQSGFVYGKLSAKTIWLDEEGHVLLHKIPYFERKNNDDFETIQENFLDEEDEICDSYHYSLDWNYLGLLIYQILSDDDEPYHYDLDFFKESIMELECGYFPPKITSFIQLLLSMNDKQDPVTMENLVLSHPFLEDVNWEEIEMRKSNSIPYANQKNSSLTQVPTFILSSSNDKFRGFSFVEP